MKFNSDEKPRSRSRKSKIISERDSEVEKIKANQRTPIKNTENLIISNKIDDSPDTQVSSKKPGSVKSMEMTDYLKKVKPKALSFKEPTNEINLIQKKPKQMKITDTLKFKPRDSEIINSNIILTSESNNLNPLRKTRRVDFFKFDVLDLDYSSIQRFYFNFRENYEPKTKIDIIKSIVEIAVNQNFYGLANYSNKTILFWKTIKEQKFFSKVFNCLTNETLRKYWRILSNIKNFDLFFDLLDNFKETIEKNNEIRILPLIINTKAFLHENRNLCEFIDVLEKKTTKSKDIDEEDDEKLSNEEIAENHDIVKEKSEIQVLDLENKSIIGLKDKFNCIKEIIECLNMIFNFNYNNEFILESLKANTFDLKKTYEFLLNPSQSTGLIFTEIEDNIIENFRNTKLYNDLVLVRGVEAVEQREKFLRNE